MRKSAVSLYQLVRPCRLTEAPMRKESEVSPIESRRRSTSTRSTPGQPLENLAHVRIPHFKIIHAI